MPIENIESIITTDAFKYGNSDEFKFKIILMSWDITISEFDTSIGK